MGDGLGAGETLEGYRDMEMKLEKIEFIVLERVLLGLY